MRQRELPLPVFAARAVREKLAWLDKLITNFRQLEWLNQPGRFFFIGEGIELRAIALSTSSAFEIRTRDHRMLIAPAVPEISSELSEAIEAAETIIFDGTFWSNRELQAIRPRAKTAVEMGHLPVEDSLPVLSQARAGRKIYTHINNTNPILTPDSWERRAIKSAGIIIGYDGLEFEL